MKPFSIPKPDMDVAKKKGSDTNILYNTDVKTLNTTLANQV